MVSFVVWKATVGKVLASNHLKRGGGGIDPLPSLALAQSKQQGKMFQLNQYNMFEYTFSLQVSLVVVKGTIHIMFNDKFPFPIH